jgi:hydrogenase expression/formation protein HypD
LTSGGAFFDPRAIAELVKRIRTASEGLKLQVVLMEVCGTHTHSIAAAGLRHMLPPEVRLISGPGCPVCVTPVDYLDRAEALAALPGTVVCTFGDLVRVPSSRGSLERSRAQGARIRVVYSPRDALGAARENPSATVIFLAVGFETTAPTIVAAVEEAERLGISNFLILPGNKTVPPPLRALARDPDVRVNGVLLPGHVSVVTGSREFEFLPTEFGIPSAVVGFTPADVLRGVLELVEQLRDGRAEVVNLYGRVVTEEGNPHARALLDKFFEPASVSWRGLGTIPASGLALRAAWAHRDASLIDVALPEPVEPAGCRCGEILKGTIDPPECPLFAGDCTPDTPVGACMVSSEGTCAAWHRHERWGAEARS